MAEKDGYDSKNHFKEYPMQAFKALVWCGLIDEKGCFLEDNIAFIALREYVEKQLRKK